MFMHTLTSFYAKNDVHLLIIVIIFSIHIFPENFRCWLVEHPPIHFTAKPHKVTRKLCLCIIKSLTRLLTKKNNCGVRSEMPTSHAHNVLILVHSIMLVRMVVWYEYAWYSNYITFQTRTYVKIGITIYHHRVRFIRRASHSRDDYDMIAA